MEQDKWFKAWAHLRPYIDQSPRKAMYPICDPDCHSYQTIRQDLFDLTIPKLKKRFLLNMVYREFPLVRFTPYKYKNIWISGL